MKTFKKTFKINAEPSDIYSALTNPYTIELWSGYPAQYEYRTRILNFPYGKEILPEKTLSLFRIKKLYRSGISVNSRKNLLSPLLFHPTGKILL